MYSTTLEKSAVEFAVDYINQQFTVDPLYWLMTLDISILLSNEMAFCKLLYQVTIAFNNQLILYIKACETLSNVSGLVVPRQLQFSYETIQSVIHETDLLTIIVENKFSNIISSDTIVIWRSTANELLTVIQSLLVHLRSAVVVLVESTEDVEISLRSVLPSTLVLSDNVTVDVMIVQYSSNDNLTDKIESAMNNASDVVNTSRGQNQSQMEIVFILNSPVCDMNTILTMVSMYSSSYSCTILVKYLLCCLYRHIYNSTMEYRWLLMPHMTAYVST